MRTMMKYGMIHDGDKKWLKTDETNYSSNLSVADKQTLKYIKNQFGKYSTDALIEYTYKKYPYYAVKSTIAHKFLNQNELETVYNTIPENNNTILYTIGYEGISLEKYLNKLILNDVKVLCDVRKNSLSMKYGFSKSQLKNACERLDIDYVHVPDLGFDSGKRQNLETQKDYDKLFAEYEKTTLIKNSSAIAQVFDTLLKKKRVALTCFEAHYCQCHRGRVANAITQLPAWKYELKHL